MNLQLGERKIRVAQMGPDFVILREPTSHPPATGIVTLEVDGRIRQFPVFLPRGIAQESKRVELAKVQVDTLVEA